MTETASRAASRLVAGLDDLGGRPRLTLAAILLVALAVRVGAIAATDYAPTKDALDYDRHARSIAAGDGYPVSTIAVGSRETAFRPPLFPYLLAAVYRISGDSVTAGRVLGALIGVAVVLLVYLLADVLWGRRVALVGAGLAAIFPPLVLLALPLLSESAFLALELAVVLAGVLSARRGGSLGWAAAAGAASGLAVLTRSNGVLLALGAAVAVWLAARGGGVRSLAPAAVVLATAALVVAPWTVRNYSAFDAFVPATTQTGFGLAGTFNDQSIEHGGQRAIWILPVNTHMYRSLYTDPDLNEAEVDQRVRRKVLRFALDHPGYVVEASTLNTLRSLELASGDPAAKVADRELLGLSPRNAGVVTASFWLALVVALAGAAVLARSGRHELGPLWIWLIPTLLFLVGAAVLGFTRYRAPLYPFVVLLAAIVLTAALERLAAGTVSRQ